MRERRTGDGRADRPQHRSRIRGAIRQAYLFPPNSTETGFPPNNKKMRECRNGDGRADRPQFRPRIRGAILQTYIFPSNSRETGFFHLEKKCENPPVTGGRTATALPYVTNLYFPAKFNRNRFINQIIKKCANAVPMTGGRTVHSAAIRDKLIFSR